MYIEKTFYYNNKILVKRVIAGDGMLVFVLAPGGFLVLGYLMVLFNKLTAKKK